MEINRYYRNILSIQDIEKIFEKYRNLISEYYNISEEDDFNYHTSYNIGFSETDGNDYKNENDALLELTRYKEKSEISSTVISIRFISTKVKWAENIYISFNEEKKNTSFIITSDNRDLAQNIKEWLDNNFEYYDPYKEIQQQTKREIEEFQKNFNQSIKENSKDSKKTIFIGHGGDSIWKKIKADLDTKLSGEEYSLDHYEVNTSGYSLDTVYQKINDASYAVIIMTDEDIMISGEKRPRENVFHELGLAQGLLGINNTVAVFESKLHSNMSGLHQIILEREKTELNAYQIITQLNLQNDKTTTS